MKTFENLRNIFLFIFEIFVLWFLKISKVKKCFRKQSRLMSKQPSWRNLWNSGSWYEEKGNFLSSQGSPDSPPVPSQSERENMIIGEEIWVNRKSFLESIFPFSEYQINFFEMIFNSYLHTFELVILPFTHLLGWFLGSVVFDRPFLICYLGNHKCWWSNRTYITDYRYTYSRKHSHFINWPLTSNPL